MDEVRLTFACFAASVIGIALLALLAAYYGPARAYAFQLSELDGKLVRVPGVVSSTSYSGSWRAVVCDSVCFEAVAPRSMKYDESWANVSKGSGVVVTGFVNAGRTPVQVILASRDAVVLVR